MDTATNFTFNSNNTAFHFNNINLSSNSNLKSKYNSNSNFPFSNMHEKSSGLNSFTLNSNLSKENTITNNNDSGMCTYSNFNNVSMKNNSKPSPMFLQWRNKQKQKKPRYYRNDINIESEEEEEEEEEDEEEENSSIPEIFNFEDGASFGKQNSNSSKIMNSTSSSKFSTDMNKNNFLFHHLEGKNKDIRSSSTPNINTFFNNNNDENNKGNLRLHGSQYNLMDNSTLNRINSLNNISSMNTGNNVKGSHPLLNCINNSRSTSSLNSVYTNTTNNNTISSYSSTMQTDNKSPLSVSSKITSSKPITIPFGSSGSLHNREDDIQMDDVFSNNNQKSLGCNSLLAKMQLDVDNNNSKNKADTQKFSKKKSFRPINRIRYLLQEESQNFLEKEIEHEAQTTLLLKQSATDLTQDLDGKDDINIPYPLYTTLVQNPQVKSPIIYTSSSKLNPENTMLSSRSREIYSLSPSSGSPLTNGNIHNIMVLSPSLNRSLKRKMSFESERFEPYYKRRVSMSSSPVSPRIGSYHDMFISPNLKQNLSASLSSNSSITNSIQTNNLFIYSSSPRSSATPQLLNIQGAYGDFSKMSLGVSENGHNNHTKNAKSPFTTLSNQNNNNNSMNLTNLRTTSNI
ncbi:hypothetical protein BCR32DRAFT_264225 [Anaeromyces robustus]|uniref:Uncharacterized protein n=1 Tax=Anaeromyces robustus TaxID=1754192 RepID=A0A1Y1XP04_9FUNG|nr:hypothetical protein BCR32DRAFT_264225 [Anaeromyces robustus]|eukprot:ORX87461.1 hypothetical protein BCR32DRAFT_264225 [Anaeromyces robustus]